MFDQLFDRHFFSPWGEYSRLQDDVNRLFAHRAGKRTAYVSYPAVNVWSDRENLYLTAEVPGLDAKDIDVSVHGRTLTLKGERKSALPTSEAKAGENEVLRQERLFGAFTRSLELPYEIDAEKVSAEYRNGILQLKLARSAKDQPKKIAIQA